MQVWVVAYTEEECGMVIGIASSEEKANEVVNEYQKYINTHDTQGQYDSNCVQIYEYDVDAFPDAKMFD